MHYDAGQRPAAHLRQQESGVGREGRAVGTSRRSPLVGWKGIVTDGYSKCPTWRKVHLAMDANTGQICAARMTHLDVRDTEPPPDQLDQIPADMPIGIICGDGAYDTRQCHAMSAAREASFLIPPRDGAASWPQRIPGAA